MCTICLQSPMGLVRAGELEAAELALRRMQLLKEAGKYAGELSGFERRVKVARESLSQLHEDYIFIEAYR